MRISKYIIYVGLLLVGVGIGVYTTWRWPESAALAKMVTVESRGVKYQIVTEAEHVADLLAEQGMVSEGAKISPGQDEDIVNGMMLVYQGPVAINVKEGGVGRVVYSSGDTVEEILKEQGIILGLKDYVMPEISERLTANMTITVFRVSVADIVEQERIPYETLTQGDPNAPYGSQVIVASGKEGVREVTYTVTYEDGQEVQRIRVGDSVVAAPTNRIVRIGQKEEFESSELGRASWYRYQNCMCAAHPFFPKGSLLKVTHEATGKSIVVRVNDVGPNKATHPDRVIDLDATAFGQLASLGTGTISVKVEKIKTQ